MSDNLPAGSSTIDCPMCGRANRVDPERPFCTSCGARLVAGGPGSSLSAPARIGELRPSSAGMGKQVVGGVFVVLTMLMALSFALNPSMVFVLLGAIFGGTAAALLRRAGGDTALAEQEHLKRLQHQVMQLARQNPRLTVPQVAGALGWTAPLAERVLDSLDDGIHLYMMPNDEGVMIYELRELPGGQTDRPLLG